MDRPEVSRDCRHRRSTRAKPVHLRVRTVALRLPLQDLLGEQGFTPKSDQALLIQERGVERPETHLQYPYTVCPRSQPEQLALGNSGIPCAVAWLQ